MPRRFPTDGERVPAVSCPSGARLQAWGGGDYRQLARPPTVHCSSGHSSSSVRSGYVPKCQSSKARRSNYCSSIRAGGSSLQWAVSASASARGASRVGMSTPPNITESRPVFPIVEYALFFRLSTHGMLSRESDVQATSTAARSGLARLSPIQREAPPPHRVRLYG